jgi:hypothetical protein
MNETITSKAFKILALGLNQAAPDGEWQSAAVRFFGVLRKQGAAPEQFVALTGNHSVNHPEASYVMPFGKYKGVPITDVPDGYIVWIWETMQLRDPLKSAIENELERRGI